MYYTACVRLHVIDIEKYACLNSFDTDLGLFSVCNLGVPLCVYWFIQNLFSQFCIEQQHTAHNTGLATRPLGILLLFHSFSAHMLFFPGSQAAGVYARMP